MFRSLFVVLFLFLFPLSAAQAQPSTSPSNDAYMFEVMKAAITSPLTQNDVDVFVKTAAASKKMKTENKAEWERISALPFLEQKAAIQKASGLQPEDDFFVSVMRVNFAHQLMNDPDKAQLKQQMEQSKAMAPQLDSLPAEQQAIVRPQFEMQMKLFEFLMAYPDSGLKVYKANQSQLQEAIQYMEAN